MTSEQTQPGSAPAPRGRRSLLLPLYVAVIAISLIVVVRLLMSALAEDTSVKFEPQLNPEVSAWWRSEGFDLLMRSRVILVDANRDIVDAQTCLPSSPIRAGRCPEIGQSMVQLSGELRVLIEDARLVPPPAETAAFEWMDLESAAWEQMVAQMDRFAGIADGGFDEAAWDSAYEVYAQSRAFTEAELQLVQLLAEVAPEDRVPR